MEKVKTPCGGEFFLLLKNKMIFNIFQKKECLCSFPDVFFLSVCDPFPHHFHDVFRFHISLHIFSFSTAHLFKNFHKPFLRSHLSTINKSFPRCFPLAKQRKPECKKTRRHKDFFDFSNFSTCSKTITSKKINIYVFITRKRKSLLFLNRGKARFP